MPYRRQELRQPAWPEAVQILARRKVLSQNYSRLVEHLRIQRRATADYWQDPNISARESIRIGKQELQVLLNSYVRTLAQLRGAVEIVYRTSGLNSRRMSARSR
jgi:hypothetical protein